MHKKEFFRWATLMLIGILPWCLGRGSEHPEQTTEHPTKKVRNEHPQKSAKHPPTKKEHPSKQSEDPEHPVGKRNRKKARTKRELAKAIESYIKQQNTDEGYFEIFDDLTGKTLQLSLIRVHKKRLSKIGPDRYFACVDFKAKDGVLYDVDFFMQGNDKNPLTFSKFMIHKVNGKRRYTWRQNKQTGLWERSSGFKRIQ